MSASTVTYPNGQTLVSDAYTPQQMNDIFQQLTCGMLGINPPDFSLVRVDWQTLGQPFENVNYDVCYVACTPWDTDYAKIRDLQTTGDGYGFGPLTQTWTYTKGWRVAWTLYGPNAEDRARAIKSGTFQDYFNDVLGLQALYLVNDPPDVTRVPELINAQWWERADFHINMYELVTETIQPGLVQSVELTVSDSDGTVADVTVLNHHEE